MIGVKAFGANCIVLGGGNLADESHITESIIYPQPSIFRSSTTWAMRLVFKRELHRPISYFEDIGRRLSSL